MGFNPTFYAGSTKLSEVTIDSDLNMGGHNISSVDTLRVDTIDSDLNMSGHNISSVDTLRVDTIQAGRVDSPYMPITWPTETLDWGDTSDTSQTLIESATYPPEGADIEVIPAESTGKKVTISVTCTYAGMSNLALKIGGSTVETRSGDLINGSTHTFAEHVVNAGDNVVVYAKHYKTTGHTTARIDMTKSGIVIGPKTFNLTGKWLALGLDMKGLAATVKIHGVSIPYSDYAKYFPLAPTELTIPGGWSDSQVRPIVKVYV